MASTTKTRERILQTSLALFLRNGYSDTGMSDLVAEAGLSKGAFYHYYRSKQELYEEALNSFFKNFINNQEYELIPKKAFREGIRELYLVIPRLVDQMIEMTNNKELAPNYYKVLIDFYTHNEDFRSTLKEYYRKTRVYLVRLINKAKENGEVKFEPDAEVLAEQILCLVEGVGLYSSLNYPNAVEEQFDRIFLQFFRLLER